VVDDFGPFRHFVSTMLEDHRDLQIIGEASDGAEAVEKAQHFQPDLILLDIALPSLNGIAAARRIRKVSPASKILFVSENDSLEIAEEALSTGAGGYVVKSCAGRELLPGIKAVLENRRFVCAKLAGLERMVSLSGPPEGEHAVESNPYLLFARSAFISEFLASAIEGTAADFGVVQLFDSASRVLRIVAQRGFEREFLDYFETVGSQDECACSKAMNGLSRIVVTDTATDSLFSKESRDVLLRAKVGSLQCTPLIDHSGTFVGVVSTHHSRARGLTSDLLNHVDSLVAGFLAKLNTMRATP
jgi:DNA-binding NarL/FixJ family response regulator